MTVDPELVAERAGELRTLVERHATRSVRIVAVTKRFGPDAVLAAVGAGLVDIGENYAQEMAAKATAVDGLLGPADPTPRWHFIGHVQRNKVRQVAEIVDTWHAVDTARLGREIAKRAPGAKVLVQVNSTGAPTQSGVVPTAVPGLVGELRAEALDVRGLMTIGDLHDPDANPGLFRALRAMADELELHECSMGMSGDLVAALEAGSTMVRVGTALFGPRPVDEPRTRRGGEAGSEDL